MILNIFSYTYWPLAYLCEKCLFKPFAYFFLTCVHFLLLSWKGTSYIFYTRLSWNIWFLLCGVIFSFFHNIDVMKVWLFFLTIINPNLLFLCLLFVLFLSYLRNLVRAKLSWKRENWDVRCWSSWLSKKP